MYVADGHLHPWFWLRQAAVCPTVVFFYVHLLVLGFSMTYAHERKLTIPFSRVCVAPIWFWGYVADVDAPCEASKDADTHLDVEVTISGRTTPIWTNMKCSMNQI